MRSITFISLLILCVSCSSTKHGATASNKLNGTWVPVRQEMGGTALPKTTYENQKLILSDSTYTLNYTFIAGSADKGIVKYKGDKMDIYGNEGPNAGKHIAAIYKYENKELTICYNLMGDNYPEAFATKDNPMFFLSVFKKEAK